MKLELPLVSIIIPTCNEMDHIEQRLNSILNNDYPKENLEVIVADLLGYVPHTELYFHLSTADIGLVCFRPVKRYQEALFIKLFEYMAAGLPVVISAFPLWKEFVDKNRCGMTVDSRKPEEIARKVEFLLQDPQLMREMGENGRKSAIQQYNWKNEEKKLHRAYREMFT